MKRSFLLSACLLLMAATACQPGQFQVPFFSTPSPTRPPVLTGTPWPVPLPTETKAASPSATPQPGVLRIWLPPLFDPNGSSPAAQTLKARLDAYALAHPDLTLDIRIKGAEGEDSLLEALSLTRSAAPFVLPDLIALPRTDLEDAAAKGILHPLEGLSDELNGPDWYPYAREAGHVQGVTYGLPFAGDALAIAYHPSQFEELPSRWEELFVAQKSLAFYSDDPKSLLLLNLYLSTGSPLLDPSNRPTLDAAALRGVLQAIRGSRLVPLQSEQAAWTAFVEGRVQLALVWTSRFLQEDPLRDTALMPLPYPQGASYSLASTWAWALAGSDPRHDATAAELAEFLVADEFIAEWNQSGGYLSPRPNALAIWDSSGSLEVISQAAEGLPGSDLLAAVGPVLKEALSRTINGDPPEAVAQAASEALK
jgi:ABC-type glycerol-3-phosphate transport system substrate-binding protein